MTQARGGTMVEDGGPASAVPVGDRHGTEATGPSGPPPEVRLARAPGEGRTIHLPALPVRLVAGWALTAIGLLVAMFLLYLFLFTPLTASRDQHRLAQSLVGSPTNRFELTDGHVPAEGRAVGVLTVPALHLDQVVVSGTSAADLMNGPGLMTGTALPGTPGNAVIAGRRTTFGGPFGAIGSLRAGDRIRIVDGAGRFTYRVTRVFQVTGGQRDVVTPTVANRLTLITASGGLAPSGRQVVEAKLVGLPVGVTAASVAVPSYDLGLAGDPEAGGLAALWSLLTVLVLVVAGIVTWRTRRPWLVYLFAAPVVVALGLLACESVARALPATL